MGRLNFQANEGKTFPGYGFGLPGRRFSNPSRSRQLDDSVGRTRHGVEMTIECFAVVVVGGLGSPGGAILGGLINTKRNAQKKTGIEKVYMMIGGFHLSGSSPERIQKTIADIKAINPDHIVPMHCTGFQAISAFAREMPDRSILNTAGTKYT